MSQKIARHNLSRRYRLFLLATLSSTLLVALARATENGPFIPSPPAKEKPAISRQKPLLQSTRLTQRFKAAVSAYQTGKQEESIRILEEGLAQNPNAVELMQGLVTLHLRSGNLSQANRWFKKASQTQEGNARTRVIGIGLGREGQAVDQESLTAPTSDPVLGWYRGYRLGQQGHWEDARQAYFQALEDELNPDIAYNLAVSLDHLHESSLALRYYQQALALSQQTNANFSSRLVQQRIRYLSEQP